MTILVKMKRTTVFKTVVLLNWLMGKILIINQRADELKVDLVCNQKTFACVICNQKTFSRVIRHQNTFSRVVRHQNTF